MMKKVLDILKWDLMTHRRAYTLQLIAMFGIFLVIMFSPIMRGMAKENMEWNYAMSGSCFILLLGILVHGCYLTQLSSPFHGRQSRLSMLMLPASMGQKLAARLIMVCVVVPLCIILTMTAADITHVILGSAFTAVTGGNIHSYMPYIANDALDMLSNLSPFRIRSWYGVREYLTLLELTLGTFLYALVCGAVWTRHALLKGVALGIVIIVMSMVLVAMMLQNLFLILAYSFDAVILYIGYQAFMNRDLADKKLISIRKKKQL